MVADTKNKTRVRAVRAVHTVLFALILMLPMLLTACNPKKTTYMVGMRDGVKLATDVYLPEKDGSYPVILYRTPYNKKTDQGPLNLMDYGVAVVTQDSRGCHASEGEYAAFGTDGMDAYDTVEWMKTQSWFNGSYATYGGSARGITQYMQVGSLTDVAAQYIEVATPDLYSQALFQGGATRKMLAQNWLKGIGKGDYYQTIFNDMSYDGAFAASHRVDPSDYAQVTWPAIHVGGWYDCFGQGIIDGFTGYQYNGGEGGAGNSKLIMGPWTHNLFANDAGELSYPDNAKTAPYEDDLFNAMFAEALLGTTQYGDYREMPNVIYYIMGDTVISSPLWNRWATSDVWPLAHTDYKLYLQPGGTLGLTAPSASEVYSYAFDPSNPVTTLGGANLITENRGPFDQRSVENGRADVLHFDYPITEAQLVAGQISAELYVTSDCIDTDFTVKLMDVYPDGREMLISDGIIRMRYRDGLENATFMDGSGTTVYPAIIDLWSTAYSFGEGHTLRISISSSNYPRFDVNPNTGAAITPVSEATSYRIAHNSIMVSAQYPSALILPIPTDSPEYV